MYTTYLLLKCCCINPIELQIDGEGDVVHFCAADMFADVLNKPVQGAQRTVGEGKSCAAALTNWN